MPYQVKEFQDIKDKFIQSLKTRTALSKDINNINDYSVGSVVSLLGDGIADVVEDFYFNLFQAVKEGLEQIYNSFNFYRQSGKRAFCSVHIYIDVGINDEVMTPENLFKSNLFDIPVGTKIYSSDNSVSFEIIDNFNASSVTKVVDQTSQHFGRYLYSCVAVCTEEGTSGNIQSKTLTSLDTSSVVNISNYDIFVENESASGGSYAESEEEMKKRFQKYLLSLRRGTKESIEYGILSNVGLRNIKYYVNEYKPMAILKQLPKMYVERILGSEYNTLVYDKNYTVTNKLSPRYTLLRLSEFFSNNSVYDTTSENCAIVYIGYYKKFNNFLMLVNSNMENFTMSGFEYYDSSVFEWKPITNFSFSNDNGIVDGKTTFRSGDSYVSFTLDEKKWGKKQIENYDYYFVRIKFNTHANPSIGKDLDITKILTYPYPGYVNIFALKNNVDQLTDFDKTLIEEAIEDYKSAGVSLTVESAGTVSLYPTVVLYVTKELKSQLPVDIINRIKNAIVSFSNDIGIAESLDRSIFSMELLRRFASFGSLVIYFGYDITKRTKENYTDLIFDSMVNQKFDLTQNNVFVIDSMSKIDMISEGSLSCFYSFDPHLNKERLGDFRPILSDQSVNPYVFNIIY